jgi:hypothetical protein
MKTLRHGRNHRELLERLHRLRPDRERRWGRMTAPQMVCHLTDAFRGLLGERATSAPARRTPHWQRRLVKWVALYLPLPWPHTIKTRPEADQEQGGTPPGAFASDVRELEQACERFMNARAPGARREHYMFSTMTDADWCRWGYLHMDHHLRQFGL